MRPSRRTADARASALALGDLHGIVRIEPLRLDLAGFPDETAVPDSSVINSRFTGATYTGKREGRADQYPAPEAAVAALVLDADALSRLRAWRSELRHAIRNALSAFGAAEERFASIAYPAGLCSALADMVRNWGPVTERDIELGATRAPVTGAHKQLVNLAYFFDEVVREAAPAFASRTIATCRRWSAEPNFHVDQAAFTIVIPLLSAPTHYAPGERSPEVQAMTGGGLPLAMATRRVTPPRSEIETSNDGAAFVLKGLGWAEGHAPLIHSPPARSLAPPSSSETAFAVIVEATRQ